MTTSIYDRVQNVIELQAAIRKLHGNCNAVPLINPDGLFGKETENAVFAAQSFFGLPQTGEVDFETWKLIFEYYAD